MPEVCLLCLRVSEDSYEHLLPASLGGSLEVTGLICRSCNSKYGTEIDAHLERAFRGLNTLFNITNSRTGKLFDIDFEEDGKKLRYLRHDHRITLAHPLPPDVHIRPDGSIGMHLQLPAGSATSQKQALDTARKLLVRRGLDPAGYTIDNEYQEVKHDAPSVPMHLDLDVRAGSLLNRALHKIAFLSAAHLLGRDHFTAPAFDEVRRIIAGQGQREIDFQPDCAADHTPPHHRVTLHAFDGYLCVLVTLYGGFPYLIHLGPLPVKTNEFRGLDFDPVHHTYSVIGSPVMAFGGPPDRQAIDRALKQVLDAAMGSVHRDRLIHEALVASGTAALTEGDTITAEHLEKMHEELMKRLIPLIVLEE